MKGRLFDGIALGVVNAQHGWWFPEDDPPEYGWKKSSVNLLFSGADFETDTGTEPLKCYRCRITKE